MKSENWESSVTPKCFYKYVKINLRFTKYFKFTLSTIKSLNATDQENQTRTTMNKSDAYKFYKRDCVYDC